MTTEYRRGQKGQVFVWVVIGMAGLIAFLGLAVDGTRWMGEYDKARKGLSIACVRAGTEAAYGGNPVDAFQNSLQENGFGPEAYQPKEGSGLELTRGIELFSDPSVLTALKYKISTSFIRIIGIDSLPVQVRERCTTSGALITPIAVKTSAFYDSLENGTWISILGQGSQADIDSGMNYRGAVFPFIWCVTSEEDNSPDVNCPWQVVFPPLTEAPPSAQIAKNFIPDCFEGRYCNKLFAPIGTRIPTVSGTSNSQLCKSAKDAGLVEGVNFVAMIYNGEVITPDPSYGNWENVGLIGWGTFTVVKLKPNPNNCNELVAVATGGVCSSPLDISNALFPREIPWDTIPGGWLP